ncbi:MAG: hypothetical protein WCV63_08760 [Negativicutes bacterium]
MSKNPPVYFYRLVTFLKLLLQLMFQLPGFIVNNIVPFDKRKLSLAMKIYKLAQTIRGNYHK